MLMKLVKHDFKGIAKKIIPLYLVVIILAALNKFMFFGNAIRYFEGALKVESFLGLLGIFAVIAYIFVIIFMITITTIMLMIRFQKSIYGNEGYLTNTLPIKAWQIIVSKTISVLFWSFMSGFVVYISIWFMLPTDFINGFIDGTELAGVITGIFKEIGWTNIILIALNMLVASTLWVLAMFLSIGIANQFKYKWLAGIGTYLLFMFIDEYIGSKMGVSGRIIMETTIFNADEILRQNITMLIINVITIAIFFIGNKYIMEKRLNLE